MLNSIPLRAFGSGQGNCKILGQGYLQAVHSKEKKIFRHQNLQTLMNHGIHMTSECTGVETHTPPLTTRLQHTQLLDI